MQARGMLAAKGDEPMMSVGGSASGSEKEMKNILGRLVMDEGTRGRWEEVERVLTGLFDVTRPLPSWFDQNAFVASYTYI